jgi:hypothetical protein
MGKWETCFWFSTFPARLAAAVGMWESRVVCEISKERWEEGEACFWLSTPSTAPPFPQPFFGRGGYRNRGGNGDSILHARSSLVLAAPIRFAHAVSLMLLAILSNCANPRCGFRYCSACGSDFSFSYGVA